MISRRAWTWKNVKPGHFSNRTFRLWLFECVRNLGCSSVGCDGKPSERKSWTRTCGDLTEDTQIEQTCNYYKINTKFAQFNFCILFKLITTDDNSKQEEEEEGKRTGPTSPIQTHHLLSVCAWIALKNYWHQYKETARIWSIRKAGRNVIQPWRKKFMRTVLWQILQHFVASAHENLASEFCVYICRQVAN